MAGRSRQPGRTVAGKISMIVLAISAGSRSLTEIATRCDLPLSTVHRLVTELAAWRLLERVGDGTYQAGRPLRAADRSTGDRDASAGGGATLTFRDRAVPVMEDLVRAIGVSVRVGVLDDLLEVAYIQKDSLHRPASTESPAARLPAHACALGKALLAFVPSGAVDALIVHGLRPYTPFTITTPRLLRAALRAVRMSGLALCDRELRADSCAVAVPVFGPGGRIAAAIELQATDLTKDVDAWRPALVVAAGALSRELAAHHSFSRQIWGSMDAPASGPGVPAPDVAQMGPERMGGAFVGVRPRLRIHR
jgi:DNA-binding IclR family transcriptional regulator